MKKRTILTIVLALVTVFLGFGPGARPVVAADQVYHFRFAGKGADAGWTNCPSGPSVGVVCTDTYIYGAEQVYREDGTKFPSTTLGLYQYSYSLDRKGNWVSISDAYGSGEATFSIDKKLTSASASATVPLTSCTVDRRGNYTCKEGSAAVIAVSWTGQGDLGRSKGNYHSVSTGFKYHSRWSGSYRSAMASGQVNGTDLGASQWASMYDSTSSDVYITHE